MKTIKNFLFLLLSLSLVFTACDERDYDIPPSVSVVPVYEGEANMTINELKEKYAGQSLVLIEDEAKTLVIRGIVTANDVSGNIYKQIQIEDETGGICLSIDDTGLYGDYRVGQEIFIELNGLYFGLYGGYPQIGYEYNNAIGRCPMVIFEQHAFLNGRPDSSLAIAKEMNIENISSSDVGTLVTLKDVYFQAGGKEPFAVPKADGSVQTESKTIISAKNGSTIVARNSSASNFAHLTMPEGIGSVTGVLSVFNNTYQITFRDSLDCSASRFGETAGLGTKENPWTIPYTLDNQDKDQTGWIEGCIVGVVAPGINSSNPITKNEDIVWGGAFPLNNTVVLAKSADVKDWTKVVVVNLPEGSDIRAAVNLMDNAANLGKTLKVTGALKKQFGAAGLVVATGSSSEFVLESAPVSGDGTKENPYSVAQVKLNQGSKDNTDYKWATGYVVGIWEGKDAAGNDLYPNNFAKFEPPFYTDVNILIADSPDETNTNNLVCVQLKAGDMRNDLSPMKNADILKQKVTLYGALEKYNGFSGIKNVQDYTPKGTGGTDPEPGGDEKGDGTKENPFNIVSVKANQGAKDNNNFKWATGYVVGIWEGKDENGTDLYPNNFAKFEPPFYTDVNILIADSPNETNVENTVCVQLKAGEMRDDLSPMKNAAILKQKVTLNGSFEQYNKLDGIKNVQDYTPKGTGGTDPGTDPEPGDGDGSSSDKPYSVAQAITNQGSTGDPATWTKGYIVGCVKNGKTTIASADDVWIGVTSGWDLNTNVLIADSKDETDYTKCVVVNLPAGKDLRTNVNLVDNPGNYQKALTVKGVLRKYFGIAGLRDSAGTTSDFILE